MNDASRGTVHVHSKRSHDGRLSYPELRAFLAGRGLRFACMTEHIEGLTQGDLERIIAECRTHSDGEFAFVPGIEMDCFVIYFLGVRPVSVDFSSTRAIFDSLRPASRLCILSHPVKARFEYPRWVLDACDGVEILNTKHDGHHYFRRGNERLLQTVRRRQPAAVGLAGMDFHEAKNFSDVHLRLNLSGTLREDAILDSLVAGDFEIFKGSEPLASLSPLRRALGRGRIVAMDAAHAMHRALARRGLHLPPALTRTLRRVVEGGG